ncbi:trifunctional histidinol dehydrogenase [Entomophthora muscae]|uniref:Trifunctional histidinol dehydrogenase n=1 Tax=Entomophthora muscae TaxID=34485 RepID=A0ACC2TIM2_9FUNG|nr:trifunctional histidinol dehydrogenase [Entomophthora muscae]
MIAPVINYKQFESFNETQISVERAIRVLPKIFVSLEEDWSLQSAQKALKNQYRPQQFCILIKPRDAVEAVSLLDLGVHKLILSCKTPDDVKDLLHCAPNFPVERLGSMFDISFVNESFMNHLPTLLSLFSFIALSSSGSDEAHVKVLKLSQSQKTNYRGTWGFLQDYSSTDHLKEVSEEGILCMMPALKLTLEESETDKIDLVNAIVACIKSDRGDGLIPTCVSNEIGASLGLAYSSTSSIRESLKTLQGVYLSRKHGIWHKGLTSGSTQDLNVSRLTVISIL